MLLNAPQRASSRRRLAAAAPITSGSRNTIGSFMMEYYTAVDQRNGLTCPKRSTIVLVTTGGGRWRLQTLPAATGRTRRARRRRPSQRTAPSRTSSPAFFYSSG